MTKSVTENGIVMLQADDNHIFVKKTDQTDMGDIIYLGMEFHTDPPTPDSEDNYWELPLVVNEDGTIGVQIPINGNGTAVA